MRKYFRISSLTITLFAIFISISAYLADIRFLDLIELTTIDLRFQIRGRIEPRSDIVLAVIDEKSLAEGGKWPWPRSRLAKLITWLSEAGAKIIAFDILFSEPDEAFKQTVRTIERIQKKIGAGSQDPDFSAYLDSLKTEVNQDLQLAEAIRNSAAKVVLGYFFVFNDQGRERKEDKNGQETGTENTYNVAETRISPKYHALFPQSNIRLISDAAHLSGHINIDPDKDGSVRYIPMGIKCNQHVYPPVSLVTVKTMLDSQLEFYAGKRGIVKAGEITIPVNKDGEMLINYRGNGKTFEHISVTDILNGKVGQKRFRDKIVIVGATAIGIYDMRKTPFDNIFPGLEIHANIIDNILTRDFLTHAVPEITVLFILISASLLGFILSRYRLLVGTLTFFTLFIGYILLSQYFFEVRHLIVNLVYPLSALLIVYTGITVHQARQKKFIKAAFAHYLSPSVVQQLIESPESLVLGGETRYITAFFSDVQGFTSISEKLTPEALVELLNEFLTEMTDIILRYEGTVDKFEGDAIIAFFGAPNHIENHARIACMASIDMQKRLAELRERWRKQGKPELKMRIGMCTGNAVVGNMGSKSRMDYTMMGDTVNTAARLEGMNKLYKSHTMISESTKQEIGNTLVTREIDRLNVVGKTRSVTIFEVIGYPEDTDAAMQTMLDYYADGLAAYRAMEWDSAIGHFQAALALFPDDGPSQTLLARCREFRTHPPEPNWGGVYTARSK